MIFKSQKEIEEINHERYRNHSGKEENGEKG